MINSNIISELKKFNWQTIIDFGCSLDSLNERQWRFLKGLVVELAVEEHSEKNLIYVGQDHKDFDWPINNISVELKSQLSGPMYTKKGQVRKNFSIKLNNSNGTNNKHTLNPNQVADILLVIRNDGVFAIDRSVVMANYKKGGDGFEVVVTADQITEISGKINSGKQYTNTIKEDVKNVIRNAIPRV